MLRSPDPSRFSRVSRRAVLAAGSAGVVGLGLEATGNPAPCAVNCGVTHGPFVGHVTSTSASVGCRLPEPAPCELSILDNDRRPLASVAQRACEDNDLCVAMRVDGLEPDTRYLYRISAAGMPLIDGDAYFLRTAPMDGRP